jgi:hypothetical protein
MSTDPPHILNLLGGHLAAVAASGLFAAAFIVALQSALLAVLGERFFRRISLILQGAAVTVLLVLFLLFPVLSGVTPALLQSHNNFALWFPPFWFLGLYQVVLDNGATLPVFHELALRGCAALLAVALIGVGAYPLAYFRRVKYLLEGAPPRAGRSSVMAPLNGMLHALVVRGPVRRAVFHFINQTLLRVQRYRIYLVLYGGVGLSVLIATVLRLTVSNGHLRAEASADGIRVAVGIVAFWVTTGLRTAFVSHGNQRGNWIFRFTHGRPAHFGAAMDELVAAKVWVLLCSLAVTEAAVCLLRFVSLAELLSVPATAAQLLVGAGVCLLLTDAFFANVMIVPFTGEAVGEAPNLAFTLLKFFTFFPFVTGAALLTELWTEAGWQHFGAAVVAIVVIHLWLRYRHREQVRINSAQAEIEEGEDEFPMRLGLRY